MSPMELLRSQNAISLSMGGIINIEWCDCFSLLVGEIRVNTQMLTVENA